MERIKVRIIETYEKVVEVDVEYPECDGGISDQEIIEQVYHSNNEEYSTFDTVRKGFLLVDRDIQFC